MIFWYDYMYVCLPWSILDLWLLNEIWENKVQQIY